MKELELKPKDEIVISDQKQIEKRLEYLKSLNPKRGHSIFELNLTTGDMAYAEMEAEPFDMREKDNVLMPHKKKVIVKEGHYYCSALNFKNAAKHFLKMAEK